jgi:Uma2 family endonuclease
MSTARKLKLTEAEYLARENASEFRSEFYDGEVFAMTGGSIAHNRIKENLVGEIYTKLKGGKCQSFSSDQRVKVQETGFIAYLDIIIVCGEPKIDATDDHAIINPQVIIEVLSPSTQRRDRIFKFGQYQQIPSLKEYILVSQSEIDIEQVVRNENNRWEKSVFAGAEDEFTLVSIPMTIKVADIFAGVEFQNA